MNRPHSPGKGRPQEYRGTLTPSQIAEGMNAAIRNGRRLAADAKILLEAGRLPTAAAIAALSIEESGKVSILRSFATAATPEQIRVAWQNYRDHRSKNGAWILPDLIRGGARRLADLAPVVERDGEHTALLNSLKQLGLYTDCYGDAHWSEPTKIFAGEEARLAKVLVDMAELLARGTEVTVREIELWIEHLGPVWGTSEMLNGLMRYATAMHRDGLSDSTPEEYAKFVFGELISEWNTKLTTEEH
jgi:AbiV family abortive infection protein